MRELEMELQKSRDVFRSIETLVELLDVSLVRYEGPADEMMIGMAFVISFIICLCISTYLWLQEFVCWAFIPF